MHDFQPFNRLQLCRYGQMLYNVNDLYVGRSLDLYGEFSELEISLFRQAIRPGHVVLDIGANIGAHTLFFARHVGPTGQVFAFEPQRIVFQSLCANMALNHVTNTLCLPVAVGAQPGSITVPIVDYLHRGNFGGLPMGGQGPGDKVVVLTLDSLSLPRCDFLKVDVEGMEESVLRGASRTIAQCRPILYVENDRKDRAASLIRYVASLDYQMYWSFPPLYNPDNYRGNATNVFGDLVSENMLCVPRGGAFELKGFPRVEIPPAPDMGENR